MDRQNNTHALVESSILTSIAVVLVLMNYYLPIFFLIGMFLWPIPITLIYIRNGAKFSIISLAVTFIITAMVTDPISAIGLVAIYGLLSVVLGYCITRKKTAVISILIMSVAAFLSTMALYKLLSFVTGQDIISQGIKMITQSYSTAKSMYTNMGVSKSVIDTTMASLPSSDTIRMIVPSVFILYSVLVAFFSYLLTQKILKKFKYNISKISPISEWYIPSKVSIGIILVFLISFILVKAGMKNGDSYFINANILFNYTFMINAIAFIMAMLKKKNIGKPLSWVIIVFCILPPISTYLFFVGIIDYVFDYRKLDSTRKRYVK